MREHDKSADMPLGYAANQNRKPIKLAWYDGYGWNVETHPDRASAETAAQDYRQQGFQCEVGEDD